MEYRLIVTNNLKHLTKVFTLSLILLFLLTNTHASEENTSNRRVFITEFPTTEETRFVMYYTPLMDNIQHPKSIYYLNAKPTKAEILHAATKLPTYSFILINKDRLMLARYNFKFNEDNQTEIHIEEYSSGKDYILPNISLPSIPEHRYNEIQEYIINDQMLPVFTIFETLDSLNKSLKTYELEPSKLYIPTQIEINDAFLKFTYDNKIDRSKFTEEQWQEACYDWAQKGYQYGINDYEILYLIYEYIYNDIPLDEKTKERIKNGFNGL